MEIYNDTYCVYVHINKIDGKKYVGQTCQKPERRWGKNGNNYKDNQYFYRAIQKYGWDNFEHEVIASNLTHEEADNFEKLLIDKLNLTNPNNGYNIDSGGNKNKRLSESTKLKLSEKHKGKKLSEEHKRKISDGLKGHDVPEEVKEKISKNQPNFSGDKHPQHKRVNQYDRDGNFIKTWNCIKYAAEELNISKQHISDCCRENRKSAGGYRWKYADNC